MPPTNPIMLEYLQYPFFRSALWGMLIISVAAAIIGSYIITRRLVSLSGGITHACFGGLGLGYFLGMSPIAMAGVFAVLSSLGVEWLSSRLRIRDDSAVAVIWAVGMAIGVLFVFLTPGYVPELNAFLFGNILNISDADLLAFAIFLAILTVFFCSFYKTIIACAFDRDFARVAGLPVKFISCAMTVLVALCIVLTIRLAGIMMLMAMLTLPQMVAETFCTRFRSMVLVSIAVSVVSCTAGLFAGATIDVPCSALIVLIQAGFFLLARIIRALIVNLV